MEFTWKITQILELESIGENWTPKQSIVVEEITERDYPASIVVDFWRDNTETISSFDVGDEVKVHLNSRAREYNGRWYNSISGWKVEKVSSEDNSPSEWLPF